MTRALIPPPIRKRTVPSRPTAPSGSGSPCRSIFGAGPGFGASAPGGTAHAAPATTSSSTDPRMKTPPLLYHSMIESRRGSCNMICVTKGCGRGGRSCARHYAGGMALLLAAAAARFLAAVRLLVDRRPGPPPLGEVPTAQLARNCHAVATGLSTEALGCGKGDGEPFN